MSQADVHHRPDEQAHDVTQQNVTPISVKAELCRATEVHGDFHMLTDAGPWTARWLCPYFLLTCVHALVHSWQTETHSVQKKQLKLSHSSMDLSLTHASAVTEMCSYLLSRSRKLLEAVYSKSKHQCIKIISSLVCHFQVQKGHSDYAVCSSAMHTK